MDHQQFFFVLTRNNTTMPRLKSQKRAETDKKVEKALDDLSKNDFMSLRQVARENNVSHVTLRRRFNGGLSTAESREYQQNLTISEEKTLVE